MKRIIFLIAFLSYMISGDAQTSQNTVWGVCCSTCAVSNTVMPSNPKGGGNNTINNGNGTIATNYTHTACGLGYVQGGVKLGKRGSLNGVTQKAPIVISGIPPCAIIEKAWLYTGGCGNGVAINSASVTNPANTQTVTPMTLIGSHINKCWGYPNPGTHNYRADITQIITGNGTYSVAGIPVGAIGQNDMDGASILIVYRNPTDNFTGHIVIGDGCQVNATTFGILTNTLTGFVSCAASTNASGFYMISDLQNIQGTQSQFNSAAYTYTYPAASNNWWDFYAQPALPVAAGQASFAFGTKNTGDCYNIVAEGIYWQTNCNVCASVGVPTAQIVSNTPICQGGNLNIAAVHNATSVTTFTWSGPNAFASNAQNLTFANAQPSLSGVYHVTVSPVGACVITKSVQVMVYPNPTITAVSNSGPVCQGGVLNLGSAANTSATATYSWTGPNAFTANTQSPSIVNVQPAASGFYTVMVSNTYTGALYTQTAVCSAFATFSAVVVPISSITVIPSQTICQNSNLSLTANALSATSYSWSGPQNFTTTLANPTLPNVNPLFSGDYSVTASYVSSSTTLVCKSYAVSNVSVVPRNPVMPFSTANVCQNGLATFSATAVGANGYQWNGPNGFTSTLQINSLPNVQPVSSGNYSVNAIFVIGSVSCTTSSYIPINVIAVPSVAVIPSITVCERQGASFSANAPNALTYMWAGPNSFTMNSPNPIFSNLTPSMSGMYTVTASFSNGNLTCFSSNQTNLLVKPIMPFNIGPDQDLCSNSDLFLNGPAGATQYNWWGSTSYTSSTQALFVPGLTPANSGIYVLEVDLNGCKTYDSVRVNVLSPIAYTLTPSNRSICRGEKVEFVVGASQGSENYAYTWNPAIYITSPTGSLQAGEPLGTTVYNISAYDIACPNYVIQTSFTITVKQPPVPNIAIPKNNACEPLCMLFNTKSQASSVTYDFGNNKIVEGDSVNVCFNAGNHYMKIITVGSNGCKGTYDYSVPITVYPKPGADFTWNPETPNTSNNMVTFMPTTKNGKTFTYEWQMTNSTNIGGLDTSSMKNPTKAYDNNGKFPVMLVVKNEYGCIDTVFKVILVDEDFNVYIPNTFTPNDDNVNDSFNVKGLGLKAEGYVMQIFDRWGTLVYTTKDINKGWDGTVKGLKAADGVYIYEVKVIGGNGVGKKEFKGHVTLLK